MNTFRFRYLIVFLLMTVLVPVFGQEAHPILRTFEARVVESAVRLNWTMLEGSTCEGVRIQRSEDAVFFTTIGEIEGVCGSPDVAIPYVFSDENPVSYRPSYYRLELGTQGYSVPLSIVYVPFNSAGYSLQIDIAAGRAIITFDQQAGEMLSYSLFSISGRHLNAGHTSSNKIIIPLDLYPRQMLLLFAETRNSPIIVKIPNP